MSDDEQPPYAPLGFKCGGMLSPEDGEAMLAAAREARAARAEEMPDETAALKVLHRAFTRLKELGWREANYAPVGRPLLLIEAGSTGVHQGDRDAERRFWIHDQDTWPFKPILFKEPGA
jgi:hypothetical protein